MSKPRSQAADLAVYLVVRAIVCFLQMLSFRAACRVATGLAWLIYHIDRRHRLAALDNLRHAFGDGHPVERDRLVRAVYGHFCRILIEMIHLPRKLHPTTWKDHIGLVGGERIVGGLLGSRPVLIVTGHFGNWEMAGYAVGLFGFTVPAIARRLDNRRLDHFFRRFRERTGQPILDKNGDFDKIEGVLAKGGALATLGDQDAGQRGLFVDFFGRPASTHKAIALLSLQHNAPLLVLGVPKVGEPMRYNIVLEEMILPEDYADLPLSDAVRGMTQRFTSALERLIRRYPEQYFWLHRRWKHQPKPRGKHTQAA